MVLDPVASVVFEAIGDGVDHDVLVGDLAAGFGVPAATISGDLQPLLLQLDEQALLRQDGLNDDGTEPLRPRFLHDPPRVCGPSLEESRWARTRTVRIGDRPIGVRATEGLGDRVVAELFRDHLVDEHAPTSFSLVLAERADQLHRLIWGTCTMVRTPDPTRVTEALVRHVLAGRSPTPGMIPVRAPGLLHHSGQAILVDDGSRRELARRSRDLTALGFRAFDAAVVEVARDGERVVVPDGTTLSSGVDLTRAACRRLDPIAPPGAHPLKAFVTFGPEPGRLGVVDALYLLQRHVERGRDVELEALVELAHRMTVDIGPGGSRADLLTTLTAAAA